MQIREVQLYSDGLRLDGRFYSPDRSSDGQRRPLIVACSGFLGLYRIHPERFARWFTNRGYVCYSFDYRGYGNSEGQRYRVILEEQVRDVRSAVAVASALRAVDKGNVFLLGWAMGGGLIIDACRELNGIKGILSLNGLYDGRKFELAHRGPEGIREFQERIHKERFRRARTGVVEYVDPFDVYPLDDVTQEYVTESLETVEGYQSAVCSFELAESLMRWSVLPVASQLQVPLFVGHGDSNKLHPPEQVEALEKVYGGPVRTFWLEDAGHTEWMSDDNPKFQRLCEEMYEWLEQQKSKS